MKKQVIADFLNVSLEEIESALTTLTTRLDNSALRIVATETEAQLVTAPELSDTIEQLRKDDLKKNIGKAGAETLAIILYRGPVGRSDIDRVRGVNSSFILRNLLIRGLIARKTHPTDSRTFTYSVTSNLLNHLGITKPEELTGFAEIMNALDSFEEAQIEEGKNPENTNIFESN